jgi:hypothetical protein
MRRHSWKVRRHLRGFFMAEAYWSAPPSWTAGPSRGVSDRSHPSEPPRKPNDATCGEPVTLRLREEASEWHGVNRAKSWTFQRFRAAIDLGPTTGGAPASRRLEDLELAGVSPVNLLPCVRPSDRESDGSPMHENSGSLPLAPGAPAPAGGAGPGPGMTNRAGES